MICLGHFGAAMRYIFNGPAGWRQGTTPSWTDHNACRAPRADGCEECRNDNISSPCHCYWKRRSYNLSDSTDIPRQKVACCKTESFLAVFTVGDQRISSWINQIHSTHSQPVSPWPVLTSAFLLQPCAQNNIFPSFQGSSFVHHV